MVNIIIGNNCSGKTKAIKDMYRRDKNNSVISTSEDIIKKHIELSSERINVLSDVLDDIETNNNSVIRCSFNSAFNSVNIQQDLLDIITIICKNKRFIYLDEPELNLSSLDLNIMHNILYCLVDYCNIELWIATKDINFIGIPNANYFIVDNYNLIKIESEEVYDYID